MMLISVAALRLSCVQCKWALNLWCYMASSAAATSACPPGPRRLSRRRLNAAITTAARVAVSCFTGWFDSVVISSCHPRGSYQRNGAKSTLLGCCLYLQYLEELSITRWHSCCIQVQSEKSYLSCEHFHVSTVESLALCALVYHLPTRRRSRESAYLRQVNFRKILMGHVRTVPRNMHVKFEVRRFNRFKLQVWLTGPLRTDTHTQREGGIERKQYLRHSLHSLVGDNRPNNIPIIILFLVFATKEVILL